MRLAREKDLPRIVAIYNSTVPTRQSTADIGPVSIDQRREWFRQHTPGERPLLVEEQDGRVAAWISFESFYGRAAYRHTAEISLYLAPECRGRGMGRKMLAEAIAMAPRLSIKTLLAFIFCHNEPSLRLFRAMGFEQWGRLPDVAEMDGRPYSLAIYGKCLTA